MPGEIPDISPDAIDQEAINLRKEHELAEGMLKHAAEHADWLSAKIAAGEDIPAIDRGDGSHSDSKRSQALSRAEHSVDHASMAANDVLWRAQRHKNDHLDRYIETAKEEMDTDLGQASEESEAA